MGRVGRSIVCAVASIVLAMTLAPVAFGGDWEPAEEAVVAEVAAEVVEDDATEVAPEAVVDDAVEVSVEANEGDAAKADDAEVVSDDNAVADEAGGVAEDAGEGIDPADGVTIDDDPVDGDTAVEPDAPYGGEEADAVEEPTDDAPAVVDADDQADAAQEPSDQPEELSDESEDLQPTDAAEIEPTAADADEGDADETEAVADEPADSSEQDVETETDAAADPAPDTATKVADDASAAEPAEQKASTEPAEAPAEEAATSELEAPGTYSVMFAYWDAGCNPYYVDSAGVYTDLNGNSTFSPGDTVEVYWKLETGYALQTCSVATSGGASVAVTYTTNGQNGFMFTMPADNVSIWVITQYVGTHHIYAAIDEGIQSAVPSGDIAVMSDGRYCEYGIDEFTVGSTITLGLAVKDGYNVKFRSVCTKYGGSVGYTLDKYGYVSFTMPNTDVYVTLTTLPDTFEITVSSLVFGDPGAAAPTLSATSGVAGDEIQVSAATPSSGYRFKGWLVYMPWNSEPVHANDQNYYVHSTAFSSTDSITTFTIPGASENSLYEVYIAAEYEKYNGTYYLSVSGCDNTRIKAGGDNEKIGYFAGTVLSGMTTIVCKTPYQFTREGVAEPYIFRGWTFRDLQGNYIDPPSGVDPSVLNISFVMPAKDMLVNAVYKTDSEVETEDDTIDVDAKNGWYKAGGLWYYYKDGFLATGWVKTGGKWYYMDPATAAMRTGWVTVGAADYYMKPSGAMVTGWQKIDGYWYYFKSSGAMARGWQKVGSTWYYMLSDGRMVTGWQKIGGAWYYLKSSGAMATGWLKDGGSWYYLKPSGAMATGWQKVNGTWYYLQYNGKMVTGWLDSGGKRYYLTSSGAMAKGWQKIGSKWHYFDGSGAMQIQWIEVGGKVYYLDPDTGAMVVGYQTIDGLKCHFDEVSGAFIEFVS